MLDLRFLNLKPLKVIIYELSLHTLPYSVARLAAQAAE